MSLVLLLLVSCRDEIPETPTCDVGLTEELVFSAEAGGCDHQDLTLTALGSEPMKCTVEGVLDSCTENTFDVGAGAIELLPGASVSLGVTWCPDTQLECAATLVIACETTGDVEQPCSDADDGSLSVNLMGVAWSPDGDDDGYSLAEGDCDDYDPNTHPGATEQENYEDEDCDDRVDEGTALSDDDGDGYTEWQGDCDDEDPALNPDATEAVDGLDEDCDAYIDEGTPAFDDDGDGYSEQGNDCADWDADRFPGRPEFCDDLDQDCDSVVDEGTSCFSDDGDGMTEDDGDCDDDDQMVYLGATERPNNLDDDCDGTVDEDTVYRDDDGDAYSEESGDCNDRNGAIHPGATEIQNDSTDQDCDGDLDR